MAWLPLEREHSCLPTKLLLKCCPQQAHDTDTWRVYSTTSPSAEPREVCSQGSAAVFGAGGKPTLPLGAGERSRLHTGRFARLTCQTLSYNNCHSNCWQQCWKNPGSVPEFLPYSWSFRFLCREIKGDARRYGRRLGGGKEGRQKGNMGGLFSHQNF